MSWMTTTTQHSVTSAIEFRGVSRRAGALFASGYGLFTLSSVTLSAIVIAAVSDAMNITAAGINPAPYAIAAALAGVIGLIALNQKMDNAVHTHFALDSTNVPAAKADMRAMAARLARLEQANTDLLKQLGDVTAARDGLESQMAIDPLTGVHNRRGLEDAFKAHGVGTVFAMLDLDHFKAINDTLGHDVGDRVLKSFAGMLSAHLGDSIPVYRIGGEEFVVLFPQAQMTEVADVLDSFRRDLEASNLVRTTDEKPVSFSAGLARSTANDPAFSETYKLADAQLYVAKSTGRGKTCFENTTCGKHGAGHFSQAA